MTSPIRILVVDDEPDTLGLIELTLQTAGYQVHTAPDGEQALEKLRNESYNLVLLDVMMPGISGYDVVRRLQSSDAKAPPIVFLTAKSLPEDREMGESLGARGYLTKPTTRGKLLDCISQALGEAPPAHASS